MVFISCHHPLTAHLPSPNHILKQIPRKLKYNLIIKPATLTECLWISSLSCSSNQLATIIKTIKKMSHAAFTIEQNNADLNLNTHAPWVKWDLPLLNRVTPYKHRGTKSKSQKGHKDHYSKTEQPLSASTNKLQTLSKVAQNSFVHQGITFCHTGPTHRRLLLKGTAQRQSNAKPTVKAH